MWDAWTPVGLSAASKVLLDITGWRGLVQGGLRDAYLASWQTSRLSKLVRCRRACRSFDVSRLPSRERSCTHGICRLEALAVGTGPPRAGLQLYITRWGPARAPSHLVERHWLDGRPPKLFDADVLAGAGESLHALRCHGVMSFSGAVTMACEASPAQQPRQVVEGCTLKFHLETEAARLTCWQGPR